MKSYYVSGNLNLANIVNYCVAQLGEVVTGLNSFNGVWNMWKRIASAKIYMMAH